MRPMEEAQIPVGHVGRVFLCAAQQLVQLADILLEDPRHGADHMASNVHGRVEDQSLVREELGGTSDLPNGWKSS